MLIEPKIAAQEKNQVFLVGRSQNIVAVENSRYSDVLFANIYHIDFKPLNHLYKLKTAKDLKQVLW